MTTSLSRTSRREAARVDTLEQRLSRYHPRFRRAVHALAIRHSRVAELAESFPALLFALAVPRPACDPAPALTCVIDGLGLKEAAAAADLPLWLRKLPPEAFAGPIPKLPDGELFRHQIANHLPRSLKLSSTWLRIVGDAASVAHESAALWIAREFTRDPRQANSARLRLIGLWAWFSLQPATFGHELIKRPWTPDMRMRAALAAVDDWRTLIALHVDLGHGSIDDMWLPAGHMAGYDFLPLNSASAIAEEADAMRNCLKSYGYSVAHNRSRLWSVRRNGERVATLRLGRMPGRRRDPLPNIVELEGAGNVKAPKELWWAARQWLHTHDVLQIDTEQRCWDTTPLDCTIWRSLWRPYWLAKRGIPEWLPIAPSRATLEAL